MYKVRKDKIDLSQYKKNDVIKIQAFVRGCLCRARVSVMVQKLIDEILLRRVKSGKPKAGKGSVPRSTSSVPQANVDQSEHSTSSVDLTEIKPNKITAYQENLHQGSISSIQHVSISSIQHGSVSSIMSRFETKNDPSSPVPPRSWSRRNLSPTKNQDTTETKEKQQVEEHQEEKKQVPTKSWERSKLSIKEEQDSKQQKDKEENEKEQPAKQQVVEEEEENQPINQEQPSTTEDSKLPEKQKDSDLPAESQKNSYVKNLKLRSNATKNVSSSDKVIEEQGMRMNDEIKQLLKDIERIGEPGEPSVEFGDLFDDEEVANYYEALVGTLKAAKKRGLIEYKGQFLLKGMNDKVVISIV